MMKSCDIEGQPYEKIGGGSEMKLVVVGEPGVGKTNMCNRFMSNEFEDHPYPGAQNIFKKVFDMGGTKYSLSILDTIDESNCSFLVNDKNKSHGFFVLFSLTDRSTFLNIPGVIRDLVSLTPGEKVPFVLVGTKSDLVDERAVSESEGRLIAKQYGVQYFEISSKEDLHSVIDVFISLIALIRDRYLEAQLTVPGVSSGMINLLAFGSSLGSSCCSLL